MSALSIAITLAIAYGAGFVHGLWRAAPIAQLALRYQSLYERTEALLVRSQQRERERLDREEARLAAQLQRGAPLPLPSPSRLC